MGIPDSSSIDGTTAIDITTDTITLSSADYSRFKHFKYNSDSYNGVPVYLSGTAPTGLDTDTVYYIRFSDDVNYYITLHPTEKDAVANTNIIDLTTADGTFRLTQEGIVLDDAFQGHWHTQRRDQLTASQGTDQSTITSADADGYAGDGYITDPITDGSNGTPRTSNETRPKTMMMFKYVKAEYVTTAGEPISALRYDTGVVTNSSWSNELLNVNHNLNEDVENLIVDIWISPDNSYWQKIDNVTWEYGSSLIDRTYALALVKVDVNNFNIQTGVDGIQYLKNDGTLGTLYGTLTGYYRVVITKPNLVSTIFDTVEMPRKYNISAENKTVTLPLLTGVNQKRTYKWTGGDGTYKLQFSVPDNTGTYSTSEYEGEGEGIITFEATNTDSGLAWEVTKYEDRLLIADSGINTDRYVIKGLKYATARGRFSTIVDLTTANSGLYASSLITLEWGFTFTTNPIVQITTNAGEAPITRLVQGTTDYTGTSGLRMYRGDSATSQNVSGRWEATGTWK